MTQPVENKVEEAKQIVQEKTEQPKTDNQETPEQINWKKFREAREQDRKAKEIAEREAAKKAEEVAALKAAMEALLSKPAPQQQQEAIEESDEDKIQRRIDEAINRREKEREEKRMMEEQRNLPITLSKTFNDFDSVCSTENLDYLEYHYPEVAAPYKHLPDSFDKWAAIYKAVKRFVPNPNSQKDQKKAEKNFNKPQSMAVGGNTVSTDSAPIMLDDKRRQDNWARMQRVMRGGR